VNQYFIFQLGHFVFLQVSGEGEGREGKKKEKGRRSILRGLDAGRMPFFKFSPSRKRISGGGKDEEEKGGGKEGREEV